MRFPVEKEFSGKRLDMFLMEKLKSHLDISRSTLDSLISKHVQLNQLPVKKGVKLKEGYFVDVDIDGMKGEIKENNDDNILPVEFKLDIIEETSNYIVINKPKGVAVHPGKDNENNTIANYLKHYLLSKGEYDENIKRGGIVHRLDKGVGGVLLCAKNAKTQRELQSKFENREVVKLYLATCESISTPLVETELSYLDALESFKKNEYKADETWIKVAGNISRSRSDRRKMVIGGKGKECLSYVLPLKDGQVLVNILTGRMHQIRATLNYLGWVVAGDELYGSTSTGYKEDEIALDQILLRVEIDGVVKEWSVN